MQLWRRLFLSWVLTLSLVLTALAASAVRGQAAPFGSVVICGGLGMAVVLDARGAPIGTVEICPEGIATALTGLHPGSAPQVPFEATDTAKWPPGWTAPLSPTLSRALARAPPLDALLTL